MIMECCKNIMNDKLAKLLFNQGSKWEDHLHQIENAHNPATHASLVCLNSFFGKCPRDTHICYKYSNLLKSKELYSPSAVS